VTPSSDGPDAAPGTRSSSTPTGSDRPSKRDAGSDGVDIDTDAVDPVLFRTFWGSVIAVNVAMAAVPLGVLLITLRGDWGLGGLLIAIGGVAAAGTVRFYLTFRADRRDGDDETDEEVTAP